MRERRDALPYLALLGGLMVLISLLTIGDWLYRRETPGFGDIHWDIAVDGGWIEILRGAALVVAATLLVSLGQRHARAPVLFAWGAVLAVVAMDDLFGLHERIGGAVVRTGTIHGVLGLRAQDIGELASWGTMLGLLAILVVVTHVRSAARIRAASTHVAVLVIIVGTLSLGLDMASIVVSDEVGARVYYFLNLLEIWFEATGAMVIALVVLSWDRRGLPVPRSGPFGMIPRPGNADVATVGSSERSSVARHADVAAPEPVPASLSGRVEPVA